MSKKKIGLKITQDPDAPIPVDVLAGAILDIADGMRQITQSRLTREAIVALIKDNSGVSKSTINVVLNNLEGLERIWLKPRKV